MVELVLVWINVQSWSCFVFLYIICNLAFENEWITFSNHSFLPDFLSLNFNMFNQTAKSNYSTSHISLSGISTNNWIAFLKVLQNQFWSYEHFTTANSTQSTKGFINLVTSKFKPNYETQAVTCKWTIRRKKKTIAVIARRWWKKWVVDGTTAGDSGSSLITGRRSLLVSPSHVVQPLDIWWF